MAQKQDSPRSESAGAPEPDDLNASELERVAGGTGAATGVTSDNDSDAAASWSQRHLQGGDFNEGGKY